MTNRELSDQIKKLALEVGFSKAGITSAAPFEAASEHLNEWLSNGMQGYMSYMVRNQEKRRDPQEILPGAKSILSLALNYFTPVAHNDSHLKISRYAWGTDYHEIIPHMLSDLLDRIKTIAPGCEGRYYVDTGPVLEKAVAERAGIGWIGKHTNVITRELGSWVFLAEIFLTIELEADAPAEDLCGSCTKCIDACPTNAIVEPYVVDARKCLSYLTIELKTEHSIPNDLADHFANWLYGCDICQDVCPWNRFEQPTAEEAFVPRPQNLTLTREEVVEMTQEEFSERFRKSPVKRTKLAGLKRNANVLSSVKS
jgi:epoxyqueuosine reductase